MTLEVGRIDGGAFGHQAFGNVCVPPCMLAISVGEQCNKPRRGCGPAVDGDAAATAAELDCLVDRQFKILQLLRLAECLSIKGTRPLEN